MSGNEQEFAEQPDIGLAAVMERIDHLAGEINALTKAVDFNTAAIKNLGLENRKERSVLSQALKIIQEDTTGYDVQFVSAFARISSKMNEIMALIARMGYRPYADSVETHEEQIALEIRPYRPVPVLNPLDKD